MPCVVGICGLTGAGKTTALEILKATIDGREIYLGQAIFDELDRQGFDYAPENQKRVRMELRAADAAAMVRRNIGQIRQSIEDQQIALVDAVMSPAELDCLQHDMQCPIHLLHIDASRPIRAARLENRGGRSMTAQQVDDRDQTEHQQLNIEQVFSRSTAQIVNEGSIDELARALADFVSRSGL